MPYATCLVLTFGLVSLVTGQAAEQTSPNVLLVYVDNLGYGDLGCYGNPHNRTPRIDQLAQEGVRCTDFYVVASSCTPSRGALLTGRYPLRNGLTYQMPTVENWTGLGLPHRERVIPQYLQPAGYVTACFGKWNIGFAPGSRPTERGFDEFLGFRSGNIHYFAHTYLGEYDMFFGTERHRVEGYSTDIFADAACDFMQRHRERSWFMYLPFNAVHYVGANNVAPGEVAQWQVPARYLARYGCSPDEPDPQKRFRATLTALDDAIGRVLDTLQRLEQRERTLVVFISDNGAFMLADRGLEVQSNKPFRDGGTTAYEGGVRVPAIFRWPGRIRAGTVCGEMLSHLDVLPLCLAAVGLPQPVDRILDGRDPLPALTGAARSSHQRLAFAYGKAAGLREGNWKIVRDRADGPWQLYDLASDPGEARDLAASRPADVARLDTAFQQWLADVRQDASESAPRPGRQAAARQR